MTTENKEVNGTTANGTDGVEGLTQAMQDASLEDLGRKIFVGNLSFSTQEAQLQEVFSKHGVINEVQIIYRGTRSLGYGFVTFGTVEEAEKAVAATDKSEIDGRTVNVEIAKPTPATKSGKSSKASANDKAVGDEDKGNQTDTSHSGRRSSKARRGRGRGRGRGGRGGRSRRPTGDSKSDDNGESAAEGTADDAAKGAPKRSRSGRGRRGGRADSRPRKVGPPEGEPSKTLLFVANLPFGLTDEGLKEFFSAYPVTSAHVVRRKYGSTVGRSKGFGFVEFENEEAQLKALAETEGKELEGRALHIKIAVNEAKKDGEDSASNEGKNDAGQEAPAPNGTAA